jgi:hypothetical protein
VAIKSVIDIPVNDEEFVAFQALFAKYEAGLNKMPGMWGKVLGKNKEQKATFDRIVAALMVQKKLAEQAARAEEQGEKAAKATSSHWQDMADSTKKFAGNIADATKKMLGWAALGTVFTGLIGGGGLFGMDTLGHMVGDSRRRALGLGMSIGQMRAFDVNYSRVVDSGSVLSGVQNAMSDPSARPALYGAGLSEADLSGKNAGQVAEILIQKMKGVVDRTPDDMLKIPLGTYHLGELGFGLEDLRRLKNTSASEVAGYGKMSAQDRKALELSDANAKMWQDFSKQMNLAGAEIENVLVRGLIPLVTPLKDLSIAVVKSIETFVASGKLKGMVESLGGGIDWLAGRISDKSFQTSIAEFCDNIGSLAKATADGLRYLGLIPKKGALGVAQDIKTRAGQNGLNTHKSFWSVLAEPFSGVADDARARGIRYRTGKRPINNPGALMQPGSLTDFQQFSNLDSGVQALGSNLRRYGNKYNKWTPAEIINRFEGGEVGNPHHNNIKAYIDDVVKTTGFKENQRVNLNDNNELAKLIAAIIKHEGIMKGMDQKTIVQILNNTGGSAVVQSSQVGAK